MTFSSTSECGHSLWSAGPGGFNSLYQMPFQQWNCFSPCGPRTPGPHSAPGDSPFPQEYRQVSSCGVVDSVLPLFTVVMEFKPSPFSLFSSVPVAVSNFHFLSSCFWGGAFPIFYPPITVLSLHAKAAPCPLGLLSLQVQLSVPCTC